MPNSNNNYGNLNLRQRLMVCILFSHNSGKFLPPLRDSSPTFFLSKLDQDTFFTGIFFFCPRVTTYPDLPYVEKITWQISFERRSKTCLNDWQTETFSCVSMYLCNMLTVWQKQTEHLKSIKTQSTWTYERSSCHTIFAKMDELYCCTHPRASILHSQHLGTGQRGGKTGWIAEGVLNPLCDLKRNYAGVSYPVCVDTHS